MDDDTSDADNTLLDVLAGDLCWCDNGHFWNNKFAGMLRIMPKWTKENFAHRRWVLRHHAMHCTTCHTDLSMPTASVPDPMLLEHMRQAHDSICRPPKRLAGRCPACKEIVIGSYADLTTGEFFDRAHECRGRR